MEGVSRLDMVLTFKPPRKLKVRVGFYWLFSFMRPRASFLNIIVKAVSLRLKLDFHFRVGGASSQPYLDESTFNLK